MTTPLTTTITELEDRILETITSAQAPVVDAVTKAVEAVEGYLPEDLPELPFADKVPTANEIVDTQFAFAKKLLDTQYKFTKAVLKAAAPLLREPAKPVAKATKAATKAA